MHKLSLIALLAAGIFALYTAPSFAASTIGMTGGGGGTPPCKVNCGGAPEQPGEDPTEPGDPFIPFGFPEGGGGPDDPDEPDVPEEGEMPDPQCQINCDPDMPDLPGDNPQDDPGLPGDGDGLTKAELAELRACIVRLEGLPTISANEIKGFSDPSKVSLVPVCEVKSLTEAQTAIVDKGNVIGLEGAIKANALMRTKLGMTAYKARDVVGIDFDEKGNATLFVHKRG
jgi:hypothetical protein